MNRPRYLPEPDGLNAEFYRRAQPGILHVQRCSACGITRHPPRYLCPECSAWQYEWMPSTGHGRLHSWVVTHFPFDPGWAGELPYATAVVELDAGVRMVGHLVNDTPTELRIGMPVQVVLEPRNEDFVFLSIRPMESSHDRD